MALISAWLVPSLLIYFIFFSVQQFQPILSQQHIGHESLVYGYVIWSLRSTLETKPDLPFTCISTARFCSSGLGHILPELLISQWWILPKCAELQIMAMWPWYRLRNTSPWKSKPSLPSKHVWPQSTLPAQWDIAWQRWFLWSSICGYSHIRD